MFESLKKQRQHPAGDPPGLNTTSSAFFFYFKKLYTEEPGDRQRAVREMCSLNRTLSLSVFPREPAAGLDATVDYVKVGPRQTCSFIYRMEIKLLQLTAANKTWIDSFH